MKSETYQVHWSLEAIKWLARTLSPTDRKEVLDHVRLSGPGWASYYHEACKFTKFRSYILNDRFVVTWYMDRGSMRLQIASVELNYG